MARRPSRRALRLPQVAIVAILVLVAVFYARFADRGAPASSDPTRAADTRATPAPNPPAAVARASTLDSIPVAELPAEARTTIALIDSGGPFPYEKDGSTFQNRERILPAKPAGYYREYTVITPGSEDRGARRIVAGRAGELYYTDDHYDSFREVLR